jgi:hypothetical protein
MAQWGRNDKSVTVTTSTTIETSNGAPIGTYVLVKGGGGTNAHQGNTNGTRANTDKNMFGNTTVGAFIPGKAVGVFGVDAYDGNNGGEIAVNGGPLVKGAVTFAGSGYRANATVTVTVTQGGTSGVVNAHANSTGRIDSILVSTAGSGYITPPTITVDVADILQFNANSSVAVNGAITLGANAVLYQAGDTVTYIVDAGNTAITQLTSGAKYKVFSANDTAVYLAALATPTVKITTLTKGVTEAGHGFRGETATGKVTVGGAKNMGITHAGWVLRTEGTGGRAGRVHYETLVAMGSLGAQTAPYGTPATVRDASDDTVLPDA